MSAEYQIKLVDRISGPSKRSAAALAKVKESLKKTSKSANGASTSLDKVKSSLNRVKSRSGALRGINSDLKKMSNNAKGASRSVNGLGQSSGALSGLSGGMMSAVASAYKLAAALAVVGAAGAAAFTKMVLTQAAFMEQQQTAFGLLLKSSEKGNAALKRVRKVAVELGLPVMETIKQFKSLLAMQFKPDAAMEIVKMAADMRALGASAEEVQRIITAVSQIKAKGKLSMEELRQQLGDAGISVELVAKQIAKLRKITKEEAMELIGKGGVSAAEGIKAIKMAVKAKLGIEKLGDAAKKTTKTLGGMWAVMKAKGEDALLTLAEELTPALKRLTAKIKKVFEGLKIDPKTMAKGLDKVLATVERLFPLIEKSIGPIMEGIETFIDGFKGGFKSVMDVALPIAKDLAKLFGKEGSLKNMKTALKLIGEAAGVGLGIALVLLGGLIVISVVWLNILGKLRQKWDDIKVSSSGALAGARVAIAVIGESINDLQATVEMVASNMKAAFEGAMAGIKAAVTGAITVATSSAVGIGTGIVSGIVSGITQGIGLIQSAAVAAAKSAITAAKAALGASSPSRVFQEIGRNISTGMGQGIEGGAPGVAASTRDMVSASTGAATSATTNNNRITSSPTINVSGAASPQQTGEAVMRIQLEQARALLEQLGVSMGALHG